MCRDFRSRGPVLIFNRANLGLATRPHLIGWARWVSAVVKLGKKRRSKGAITSKIKHAIKHKTSPARLAQLLQPSLAFCFSLQPVTAYRPYCMFYFTCDRSLSSVNNSDKIWENRTNVMWLKCSRIVNTQLNNTLNESMNFIGTLRCFFFHNSDILIFFLICDNKVSTIFRSRWKVIFRLFWMLECSLYTCRVLRTKTLLRRITTRVYKQLIDWLVRPGGHGVKFLNGSQRSAEKPTYYAKAMQSQTKSDLKTIPQTSCTTKAGT